MSDRICGSCGLPLSPDETDYGAVFGHEHLHRLCFQKIHDVQAPVPAAGAPEATREAPASDAVLSALGFFKSCILSGEPWGDACQRAYDAALSDEEMRKQIIAEQEARIATLQAFVDEFNNFYPDCAQLLDGWHADGTAWSAWDESVRQHLTALGQAALAARAPEPAP